MRGNLQLISNAKKLRGNQTDVENILWLHLRNRRFYGYKFRRQMPINKYIVDFVCLHKKLIIECDGGQHANNISYDQIRDNTIEILGYRIKRYWNNEILENLNSVLEDILHNLRSK